MKEFVYRGIVFHYAIINFEGHNTYVTLKSREDNDCIFDQLRGMILEEMGK